MINKLRVFFCMVFVVVLPLCFSACKSSENPQLPDGEVVQPSTPEKPSDDEDNPAVSYVIDDAELNRILKSSYDVCEDFIVNLNNSNLLTENGYTSDEGGKTYPVFDYAFYPARFAFQSSTDFDSSKIYSHWVSTTKNFFEVGASETNDKVYASIFTYYDNSTENKDITALFYEFGVTNGNIDSLKISYIYADSSNISFSESMLDFKNSVCEIALGTVNDFQSSRTFLERNFTKEKFDLIDKEKWGYSYYQKFDFKKNEFVLDKSKMPLNENMIETFDEFGFLSAFEKLDEYTPMMPDDLEKFKENYFLYCSTNGMIVFDRDNSTFEFKTEEE